MLASDWLIPTLGSSLVLMPTLGFWVLDEDHNGTEDGAAKTLLSVNLLQRTKVQNLNFVN